jgi:hypothetical protein
MLGVAQSAHQRYDIQAELALGKREGALLLGPARFLVECALPVHAATDDQPEAHGSFQRGDGAGAVIGDPYPLAARFAQIAQGLEPDLGGGFGAALVPCYGFFSGTGAPGSTLAEAAARLKRALPS